MTKSNDVKAIREALILARERIVEMKEFYDGASDYGDLSPLLATIDSALAAPDRNCDVGTAVQQAIRYHNFTDRYNPCAYKGYARCAEDCPVRTKLEQEGHGELLCQLEWAQMPYEEGGTDGK